MIKKIRLVFSANLSQMFSLYGIQLLNGIFPLIVFPYVLSIIGSELYSKFVLAEVVSIFGLIFVLWGFEITSVKKLSNCSKANIIKKSIIFFNTFYSRIILWFIFFIFSILFSLYFLEKDFTILIIGWMLVPLANIFYSTYFFLAIKNNMIVFLFLFFGRISSLFFIFYIDIDKINFFLVSYILSFPYLIFGFFLICYMLFNNIIIYIKFDYKIIMKYIITSFSIFKNMMSLSMIKEFNLIVISLSTSNSNLIALYSILDKFLRSASSLMRPIAQFFTLSLISLMKIDQKWFLNKYFFKIIIGSFFIISLGLVITYFFPLNYFVDVPKFEKENINLLLVIMLSSLYFGFLNYFFLIYSSYHKNLFFEITIISGLLGIISLYTMTSCLGALGFSLSVIVPEFFIFIFSLLILFKNKKRNKDLLNGH